MASDSRLRDPRATIGEIAMSGGLGLAVIDVGPLGEMAETPTAQGVVRVAVHRSGVVPTEGLGGFDILLSADPLAPAPWVGLPADGVTAAIQALRTTVGRQPVAAAVAAQVHRMSLSLDFDQALLLESLGYSMLLASEGFRTWRAANLVRQRPVDDRPRVALTRQDGSLSIRLTRPNARNAVDARMRDELAEALEFAVVDPDAALVLLSGEGPSFCAGGDLDEFGTAEDPGQAHAIRTLRSATRLVNALGPRATARLHGACVGAGIEIPAAARVVVARAGTVFRLPEVSMGLIPGAGGTASIPRRIGRQRACYMAISGCELNVETALRWGLVDELAAEP
jgi:enoyl-CoA hydratase/carnithine racemase